MFIIPSYISQCCGAPEPAEVDMNHNGFCVACNEGTQFVEACLQCGCPLEEHTPLEQKDWYDPRTEAAYGNGHLNLCGMCGECYA